MDPDLRVIPHRRRRRKSAPGSRFDSRTARGPA